MAAFKDKKNGSWYVQFRYVDWKGEPAEAEAWLCHKTRSARLGTGVPYAEKVRPEYDL